MKKLLLLLTFFILISATAKKNSDLELICFGKWSMEYVESSEQQIPIPGDVDENWMIFHKNGKHEVMSLGEIHFGKWVYTKDDRTIRLSEEENYINQKIELINNQKLILSFTADGDFLKLGLKKLHQ